MKTAAFEPHKLSTASPVQNPLGKVVQLVRHSLESACPAPSDRD